MSALRKLLSVDFEVFGKVQGRRQGRVPRRSVFPQVHSGESNQFAARGVVHEHCAGHCARSVMARTQADG